MKTERSLIAGQKRGRAATSNATNRYEQLVSVGIDDGWGRDPEPDVLRTQVTLERPRKVITKNSSPDVPFNRSLNPYRGCEHGCIYCFARPTHAYLGFSPGLDFETKLIARPDAAQILERELSSPRYVPRVLAIGTNTDPYQPIEKEYRIMRSVLEVLEAYQHPVAIVTKGSLIERDIDILARMARAGLVRVGISVTSLDSQFSRKAEPRVPAPKRRLRTISLLSGAGIDSRVMASPMIPGLTDHELEAILAAGKEAGATSASMIPLRLPLEVSDLFQEWLSEHFPDRAKAVMSRIREIHGGQDYDAKFGQRMTGTGHHAELLQQRFMLACRKLGLARKRPALDCSKFSVPSRTGDQLNLFR
ncbi:MAG: PA0069 family radical SAM protein [Pseudomonadota bacterium]